MSWNKNTVDKSFVDQAIKLLDELEIPYKVETLGEVQGMGLNDDYGRDRRPYEARRLEYAGFVMLERMERSADCDSDDYFISEKFKIEDEPEKWDILVEEEDYEY